MFIVFICIIVIVLLVVLYIYCHPSVKSKVKSVDDLFEVILARLRVIYSEEEEVKMVTKEVVASYIKNLRARVKIYITFWQIVSLLPFALNYNFPHAYKLIASILNVLNLGISISSLVTCNGNSSYDAIDNLMVTTIYPLVVIILIQLAKAGHLWYIQDAEDVELRSRIKSRYFNIFLIFTYLILPFVTVTIFQTFSCQNADPDGVNTGSNVYMTVDYSVSCSSSKYEFGLIWAVLSVLLYPVGIPLYYFYVLYSAKSDIMNRNDSTSEIVSAERASRLQPIRLLFEFYRPELWYWEVIETAHRLLLTGILVIIMQGSGTQIIVGTVISMSFLKLYDVCRPYENSKIQVLREICQWQIFAVFFLALLLIADFESVSRIALDVFLVLAISANFVIDISLIVLARHYKNKRKNNSVKGECQTENPLSKNIGSYSSKPCSYRGSSIELELGTKTVS